MKSKKLDILKVVILALIIAIMIGQQIDTKGKKVLYDENEQWMVTIYFNKNDDTLTKEIYSIENDTTTTQKYELISTVTDDTKIRYYFGNYIVNYDKATKVYSVVN